MMQMEEFPKTRVLRYARELYDRTLARLSLAFWTRWAGPYFGLKFCRSIDWAVTPSGRGLSKPLEFKRLVRRGLIKGQDILLIGVGRGGEINNWLPYRPKSVCTVELHDYRLQWKCVSENVGGWTVRFTQSDASALPFRNGSFDLLASFTVLEHVVSLELHMSEAHRVLRTGGSYYVVFGPLWPAYGGCHINSIGYAHLLLGNDALLKSARAAADGEKEWLEQGLLNRCKYEDYIQAICPHFRIEYEAWIISKQGLRFRNKNPAVWGKLLERHGEMDLLLSAVYLLLRKIDNERP